MINVNILNINELCLESKKIVKLLEDSRIFFLVFDIDNKDTFNILNKWIEKIKKFYEGKRIFINILGTKINPNNKEEINCVKYSEGEKFAKKARGSFKMVSINDAISLRNLIKNNVEKYLNC